MSSSTSAPTFLAAAVERLLAASGPLTDDQIADRLRVVGVDLGPDPIDTVDDVLESDELPLVLELLDGRWALLPALLDGRVFTHRVTAPEAAHGFIAITPDLTPVVVLIEDIRYERLVDGSPLEEVHVGLDDEILEERGIPAEVIPGDGALLLSAGCLTRLDAGGGGLVGVRASSDGFAIEPAHRSALGEVPAGLGERLHALLASDPGNPEPIDEVLWMLCAELPELFRHPLPPLGEIIDGLGLAHDGDYVAPAGFDFAGWRIDVRTAEIARLHRLGGDEALAVLALQRAYFQVAALVDALQAASDDDQLPGAFDTLLEGLEHEGDAGTGDVLPDGEYRRTVGDLLPYLEDPDVAQALLAETLGTGPEGAPALGLFAETLERMAPPESRAALHWLLGKARERMGEVLAAEEIFSATLQIDPAWTPALHDLARYASDRGNAAEGLALLRRAGVRRGDELFDVLEHFSSMAVRDLGRNKPCWCGSGRKYKMCHLGREQVPLAERAAWLYHKAGAYVQDGPWWLDILAAAEARGRYWDPESRLVAAVTDPLVADAVLFEGGAFAEFLDERGVLLPEDERLLAERWLLAERSVYDVEAVRPGSGITVRDLRTGDRHDVRERSGSRQLKPGMLVCARIVPAGDTMQIFGGMEPVALHERDELIELLDSEPEPDELVAFLSRRFAPPELLNTEGEPLVFCEATLKVPDPVGLAVGLDATYERDDEPEDDDLVWLEHVTTDGMQRIRATLRLCGDELLVEANSEARLERTLGVVGEIQPEASVTTQRRERVGDMRQAMKRSPEPSPDAPGEADLSDPQVAAALQQVVRQYEDAWLDESISALAGYTPRQAAADPTRRGTSSGCSTRSRRPPATRG